MKKMSDKTNLLFAYTQYQVARSVQILLKLIDDWHGEKFWFNTPDNVLHYLETVHAHGVQAKETLKQAGFRFEKGTEEAL